MKTKPVPIAITPLMRGKLTTALEANGWRMIEEKKGISAGEWGFEIRDPSGAVAWEDIERPYWPDHILIYGAIAIATGDKTTPITCPI